MCVARRCGRLADRCAGAAGGYAGLGFLGVGSLDNYGLLSGRFPPGPQRCARWVRHEHHGDWNLRRYASMDSHRRHHSGGFRYDALAADQLPRQIVGGWCLTSELSNRLDAETRGKVMVAVHARVPMVTPEEPPAS